MFSLRLVPVLCVVVVVAVEAARYTRGDDKYTTKYDHINVDNILKSDRLLNNYINCILDKGKCTPDGAELKKDLPDALTNDCAKCSEKQREGIDKVLRHLINNKPEVWAELEKKYDPTGKYKAKYDARLKELSEEKLQENSTEH